MSANLDLVRSIYADWERDVGDDRVLVLAHAVARGKAYGRDIASGRQRGERPGAA